MLRIFGVSLRQAAIDLLSQIHYNESNRKNFAQREGLSMETETRPSRNCPFCGRPLSPNGLCDCPQARVTLNLRRASLAPPDPPPQRGRAGFLRRTPLQDEPADLYDADFYEQDGEEGEPGAGDGLLRQTPEPLPPPRPFGRLRSACRNFFPFLAAFFRRPFQAMEAACRGRDLPLALLYLLLFLAGGGLFTAALARQGGRLLQGLLRDIASLTPFDLPGPSRLWIEPKEFFICGLLMALCWALLAALAVFLACRLAKTRLDFRQALILSALCGLAPALLFLSAAGALFVSFRLALDLTLLAAAVYFALLFAAAFRAAGAPSGGLFCFGLLLLLFLAFLLSFHSWTYILQPALDRLLWLSLW